MASCTRQNGSHKSVRKPIAHNPTEPPSPCRCHTMLPTSRTELIDLLSCIGVDLPLQTKLPQEAIEERLRKALDCIQQIGQVLSSTSATSILPIASFQPWPDDSKKPLESVVHRTNWLEVAEGIEKRRLTGDATYVVGSGRILMDLKVQLLNLVKYGKMGKELYIIQDKEEDSSIIVRVRSSTMVRVRPGADTHA